MRNTELTTPYYDARQKARTDALGLFVMRCNECSVNGAAWNAAFSAGEVFGKATKKSECVCGGLGRVTSTTHGTYMCPGCRPLLHFRLTGPDHPAEPPRCNIVGWEDGQCTDELSCVSCPDCLHALIRDEDNCTVCGDPDNPPICSSCR